MARHPRDISKIVEICCDTLCATACSWETDFSTPPVLGGAALFDNPAPAVYKIQGP